MTEATTKIVTDFLKEDGWWVGGSTNFFHVALYQRTNSFKSKVQLKRNGMTFDAKSFLWISLLQPNDEVTIVADGPDEAEAVRQLKELMETKYLQDFDAKLKKFKEEEAKKAARRAERLKRLEQYTTTKKFLENVDKVAFDQDELTDLIAGDVIQEIYLCANQFVIPLDRKNKTYVGIGKPVAVIQSNEPVDFDELGIKFKNVAF
ncbi:MAG: HPr family phosphocarrier protein, partial [Selenomonadaceae bacterium]|nr:HPr family phosphocarrier protein [Selenomonadaceae bacterium]